MLVSERAPSAWIDTNVMLEIYSFADIIDAKRSRTDADVETRRIRMQGTLWAIMVLCSQQAVTLSYSHEGMRNFARMSPVGSDLHAWSGTILFVLDDGGVFDGWMGAITSTGSDLTNRQRDRHMIEICATSRLLLLTRDEQVIDEAKAAGVIAMTPEAYAVTVMPRSLAERMFMDRLDVAARRYVENGPADRREQWVRNMKAVRATYQYIWKPAGPAEPFSVEAMFR